MKIAKNFGIDTTININDFDPSSRIQQVLEYTHNRGADVTIEATGVPSAVKEGIEITRDGGTYTIVGQYTNAGEVQLNPHFHINRKHLTIRGSWGSDFNHFYLAVKFIERYSTIYPFQSIISKEYSLDEAANALDDVEHLRVLKAIIKP